MQYGGSGVELCVLEALTEGLAPGSKILEIGSGAVSTRWIVEQGYDLVTIEENAEWVGSIQGAKYIHAPIGGGWYNPDILLHHTDKWFDAAAVLVDGPSCRKRHGIIDWFHLFPKNARWVWHDADRPDVIMAWSHLDCLVGFRPVVQNLMVFGAVDNFAVMEERK